MRVLLGSCIGIKRYGWLTHKITDGLLANPSMSQAEWAYVLEGNVRVTALDTEGGNYIGDVGKGDLWYFPAGHPHSLQGIGPGGCEFLLIFDDGNFSEDSTFLLSDWVGMSFSQSTGISSNKS